MRKSKWTNEMTEWLKERLPLEPGHKSTDLLAAFNAALNTTYTMSAFTTHMARSGLCFGRHGYGYAYGTERIIAGYVFVKTEGGLISKSILEWNKAHPNEKVGRGERVIFLDGNKRNFKADNLLKIPDKIICRLSQLREEGDTAEMLKAKVALATLNVAKWDYARKYRLEHQLHRDQSNEIQRRFYAKQKAAKGKE